MRSFLFCELDCPPSLASYLKFVYYTKSKLFWISRRFRSSMEHKVVSDYTKVGSDNISVKVYVRVRPCADGSTPESDLIEKDTSTSGKVTLKVKRT